MNITFVLNCLDFTGGVRVVFEYANYLQNKDHQVTVVYPAIKLSIRKRFSFRKSVRQASTSFRYYLANVLSSDRPQIFENRFRLVRVPVLYPRLVPLIEQLIPDADAVIATAWETAYAVDRLSDKKGQKFYFIQSYEIWDVWNNPECWNEAKRIAGHNDRCALAMADVIPKKEELRQFKELVDSTYKLPLKKITVSDWLRRLMLDKLGESADVVPNGVSSDTFFKDSNRRDELEHVSVLMPFRREPWKGFDDGLKALAQVKARHPQTKIAVFGRKPQAVDSCHPELPDWIEFHNNLSDPELRAIYNQTHIFVLPSWIEGFGLPTAEAMACGCAVVTTDTGGFSDYLENGKTALIVPIRNPAALAQSICRLIEEEQTRKSIADNGHDFVKRFTWERAADELEALLKTEA